MPLKGEGPTPQTFCEVYERADLQSGELGVTWGGGRGAGGGGAGRGAAPRPSTVST